MTPQKGGLGTSYSCGFKMELWLKNAHCHLFLPRDTFSVYSLYPGTFILFSGCSPYPGNLFAQL